MGWRHGSTMLSAVSPVPTRQHPLHFVSTMSRLWNQHRQRFLAVSLWLLVLLPVIGCLRFTRAYALDQRFLDDFVWAQDLVAWKEGTLTLHQLFQVHLEHRPGVARVLALAATLLAGGDVRGQNVLTCLWMTTSFCALCWLWMKRGSLTIHGGWLPLLLVSAVMFTPLQWQTLLWPVCCGTAMPLMFLMLSLCTAFLSWRWWVRCLAGAGTAILAMLSFASGFLLWVLPLPAFLWCGAFRSGRERLWFTALWFTVLAVTLTIYFRNFHNEVPAQYAYHHGGENTLIGEAGFFFRHPVLDAQFVATFCGALLARGWSADLKITAAWAGGVLLVAWAATAFWFWRHRKEESLRSTLLPMLCLAAYTPATGLMVALGRIGAGGIGTALNGRYAVHQTALIAGLIGAWMFIGRHRVENRVARVTSSFHPSPGWALAGILGGVIGVGWIHGEAMMSEWQAARYRGAAAQYLSPLFSTYNRFVASVSGNHRMTVDSAAALHKHGMLKHGLADPANRSLSIFPVGQAQSLDAQHGRFERLYKSAEGGWKVQGWSFFPGTHRPADAILLAWRVPGGEWTIFGLTQAAGAPYYLGRSMVKDMYAIVHGRNPWPMRVMCPWDAGVHVETEPPPGCRITAWALDMQKHQVLRIPHWSSDRAGSPDGATLEELALEAPPGDE